MSELAIEPVDPYDDEAALRHEAYEVRSFVGEYSDLATTIHEPVRPTSGAPSSATQTAGTGSVSP